MRIDSLIAILGMAAVTYLTRISGPWLVRLVQGNQRVEACLSRLPGSILAALLAPLVFAVGTAEAVASGITLLVALRFRNMPLSLVAGVGSLVVLRHLL
ncbi:Branched-chain amino acid transport protein (AzlD) [Pseudodesulfovibrio hydrargyri]|uniref:Branched-chain amino acid transport protein (AzlD) n=1 Tax=Pseudodesulfovibrio hydrargyri TaxID=2125990 RepID=A0A1J5N2D8_9BACT|nr:AzlD domain-containing protein [Pseudodesulfovibrio hydrargyri]OIQ48968.1 Branched-chain amino acid transport protein (AzlD) [Pseudodesulfovibrio hydrargyri]